MVTLHLGRRVVVRDQRQVNMAVDIEEHGLDERRPAGEEEILRVGAPGARPVGVAGFGILPSPSRGAALAAALQTSHPTMPNFVIKGDDANNIIAYILSLKESD